MLFDFMPGKETTDALFIVRRLEEKYLEKNRKLYLCFYKWRRPTKKFQRRWCNGHY